MTEAESYGFVYIWYDSKKKRYYVGSHWGTIDDGYICSSKWMKRSYKNRPKDFKRRIIKKIETSRKDMLTEEQRYLSMIKDNELRYRYYNLIKNADHHWHGDTQKLKTVGAKVSAAKKGKSNGPCSPERALKISEGKKAAFAKKREELGYAMSPDTIQKMSNNRIGRTHTEEMKQAASERLKEEWATGVRKARPAKPKPPPKAKGERLKELWTDPVWAENQRKRLSEGSAKRPPRSEESKIKSSITQKGIPKPRKTAISK